jgi:nitroreductase/NAD-dependent dihydropyrimidine dehydrogenase PreA subunit
MLKFSHEKCNGCGLCVRDCVMFHNIKLDETKKAIKVLSDCNDCYHCVAICPQGAVTVDDMELSEKRQYKPVFTSDEYLDFLKYRRSIRQYKIQDVERSKIQRILDAGRYTPTGGNRQPVHFAVVTKDRMKELKELTLKTLKSFADDYTAGGCTLNLDPKTANRYTSMWQSFYKNYFENGLDELFFDAPCLVLVLGDTERVADPRTDCTLAACNIGNMASAVGLGFCYNGFFVRAFQSEEVRSFLGLDQKYSLFVAMTIGYANVEYCRAVPSINKEIFWI